MKLSFKGLLLGLLIGIIACISALFSFFQLTDLALISYAIAAIMLIFVGRELIGNYSNFTVIFLVFNALYSLSGPVAVRYGGGISKIFPTPYLVDEFLLHYSLASIGLVTGLILIAVMKIPNIREMKQDFLWDRKTLFYLAYAFAVIASLLEIVNLLRVGGFQTLFSGKAAYQSAVYGLAVSLPSTQIMLLSVALLGLALSNSTTKYENWTHRLALWLVCGMPFVLNLVILGRRGPILGGIIVFVIAYFYFRPIERIELKWVMFVLPIYLIMGFLFGIRGSAGQILETADLSLLRLHVSQPAFWLTSLNPGLNEFGAVFGNFNTYILSGASHHQLGETYLRSLTMPIPRSIWPDKPQAVIYEFRDTYFPSLAQQGIIAGTAYSSMLEAYTNFGTFGVPIIYLLVAFAMGCLERIRLQSKSILFAFFYLTLLPLAQTFHRDCFWMPVFWPLLSAFVGVWSYILVKSIIQHDNSIQEED